MYIGSGDRWACDFRGQAAQKLEGLKAAMCAEGNADAEKASTGMSLAKFSSRAIRAAVHPCCRLE
jgi:hypothetical protein